ncbi:AMP-binding protein [Alcaligenaceae bacterium]|nr:AMP-binding protein [Alcaligenaceae bacterium]
MNFAKLLAQHFAERPDAVAFYDIDRPVQYRELIAESERVAALLYTQGARPGERMALWLPNCTAWLASFIACARLGITVIAMNTRFRSHEVGDLIARGKCQWLTLWPDFKGLPFREILDDVEPAQLQGLKAVMVVGEASTEQLVADAKSFSYSLPAAPGVLDDIPHASDEAHALVYTTSGTTSQSKLVVHDQQTLIKHGLNAAHYFGIGQNDAVLLGAPLCGAFGFSTALAGLTVGATLVSSPVLNPAECAAQIQKMRVTHTFANNELLDRILDAAKDQHDPFPSLRVAGFASFAPSLENLPERAEKAGIKLVGLYGSSELQALTAGQPLDAPLAERQKAGGRLVAPDARVRARDIETNVILPHGEVGEIEILAPSLMKGYLDNEAATAKAIDAQGYFRTGDLGHTLNNQHFVFLARRGDFLRLSGFLVNPSEIEIFISSLDGVSNCQVVGVAHQGKTVPVAFVIAEPGHSLQEDSIITYCKAHLAGFKVPVRICIVQAFPMVESANSNKIQRGKLQEQALALLNAC